MNQHITDLALEAGLLNYIDNETPRRYFVHGDAMEEDVERFAKLLLEDCIAVLSTKFVGSIHSQASVHNKAVAACQEALTEHFDFKKKKKKK